MLPSKKSQDDIIDFNSSCLPHRISVARAGFTRTIEYLLEKEEHGLLWNLFSTDVRRETVGDIHFATHRQTLTHILKPAVNDLLLFELRTPMFDMAECIVCRRKFTVIPCEWEDDLYLSSEDRSARWVTLSIFKSQTKH